MKTFKYTKHWFNGDKLDWKYIWGDVGAVVFVLFSIALGIRAV